MSELLGKSLGTILHRSTLELENVGIPSARLDSLILLETVLGKSRSWILAHLDETIDETAQQHFRKLQKRRLAREPIAYITGLCEFYGLSLKVSSDTLIPRPETEELVDHVVQLLKPNAKVLDIGTGSGAIALAIKRTMPTTQITASDISEDALDVAKLNAAKYSIDDMQFICSDLMNDIYGTFDLVTANLPYLTVSETSSNELAYEPAQALYSGKDGLSHYARVLSQLNEQVSLVPEGKLIIEAEPSQRQAIATIAADNQFILSDNQPKSPFVISLEYVPS